jgi:hypothetical protein
MGLDTTHDCWHGSYTAFNNWRNAVAIAAGYFVWQCKSGDSIHEMIMLEWHRYQGDEHVGEWKEPPTDPLLILFVHSDCDGRIKSEHCAVLADALEKLEVEELSPSANKTAKFIVGLRLAAATRQDVEFH